jgi:hypothetical protein
LFSTQEDATDNFTLIEPINDSLARKAELEDLGKRSKRTGIRKASPIANAALPDDESAAFSEKDDKDPLPQRPAVKLPIPAKVAEKSKKPVYEVASVAHFYNRPSEKTRRKEVINYWNQSYASIKPINEKNGFVFVEFKYPSGQRSEGWLRKKDLKKVNAAYENNKE